MSTDSSRASTRVFQSNRSQAVRLPKDVAFPADVKQVTVVRDGNRRIVVPADASWDDFFAGPSVDLAPREQPDPQSREDF